MPDLWPHFCPLVQEWKVTVMEVDRAELYTLRMNLNVEGPPKGMCHPEEQEIIIETDLQ